MSGITCTDDCLTRYETLKLRSNVRYIIYKIENEQIVFERDAPRDATWESMVDSLPVDEPRYISFDLEYKESDGRATSKLLFITWAPDNANIKKKILYSSSKNTFFGKLSGSKAYDAADMDDLQKDEVIKRAN